MLVIAAMGDADTVLGSPVIDAAALPSADYGNCSKGSNDKAIFPHGSPMMQERGRKMSYASQRGC